jgi:DNA-binding NarL/FixJ family response regulator
MEKHEERPAIEDWPASILVVDDDPVHLELMKEALFKIGIPPKLAINGEEAITQLKSDRFPIIITDLMMPHIDGMQLIIHTKKHYPDTDIIAMTGYSQKYSLVNVIRAGAVDYMNKPFTLDELKAKIKRVTRERALFQLLQKELAKYQHSELDLSQQKKILLDQIQQQKEELVNTNAALRIILRQRDIEKDALKKRHTIRYLQEILPFLEKIKNTRLSEAQKHYLDIITMNLESIFTPAFHNSPFNHKPFTEAEIKVINLIKRQKSSKEIASLLQVSVGTIRTHRENIRKKMQIINTKKNLYKTISSTL